MRRRHVALAVVEEKGLFRLHAAVGDHGAEDFGRGLEQVHAEREVYRVEVVGHTLAVGGEQRVFDMGKDHGVVVREDVSAQSGLAQRIDGPQLIRGDFAQKGFVSLTDFVAWDLPAGHFADAPACLFDGDRTALELAENPFRIVRVEQILDLRKSEPTERLHAAVPVQVDQHAAQVENDIFEFWKHRFNVAVSWFVCVPAAAGAPGS